VPTPPTPPPAPGYIYRDVSRSVRAAVSRQSFSNAVEITKAALQAHIKNYFDDGRFADFFSRVSSSAQFTLSDINAADRLAIPVQIIRRYPDFKMRLPALLINNTGFVPKRTSIANGIEGGYRTPSGDLVLSLTKLVGIPVDIICAALDPTQAAELMEDITLIFTTLQQMTQTSQVRSGVAGDNWVVTLPGEVAGVSGPAEEQIPESDEPKDKLYTYTIALNVTFESNVEAMTPFRPTFLQVQDSAITSPVGDKIRLGQTVPAGLHNRPINTHYETDNPSVAVVDDKGFIYTRGLGKFRFLLVEDADPTKIRFSKEIRVVSSL
jgi:hypothetical protein